MTVERGVQIPDLPSAEDETSVALRTVLQIAEVVNQAADERQLIEQAVDAIVAYTRFPCCGLFLLDESGQWLDMVAYRNVSDEVYQKAKRLPVNGSLTGLAMSKRAVVTTTDLGSDERVETNTRQALAHEGYVEVASVPLLYQGRALGAINFIYRAPGALSPRDREIIFGIGRTIAIALANRKAEAERQALEERVRRHEQIERLGLLAGGIAHDFNNLLTGISGTVSLAKHVIGRGAEPSTVLPLLEDAEKAAQRSAALVKQLLTFSRGGAPLLRMTDGLAALIRESAEFSARGTSVRLELDISDALPVIEVDGAQISQVIQNLVLNAIQASPAGSSVRVSAMRVPPDDAEDNRPWVGIEVEDHGCGIPQENMARLFEPYFTTKKTGNGLGLPTVQSIVRRHGGSVRAHSEVGRGTTFSLRLPGTVMPQPRGAESAPDAKEPSRGGRALVMDDEPMLRQLARVMLTQEGYDVETSDSGETAVALCRQAGAAGRPFDVVVLDLTVAGGVGGKDAMAAIRACCPDIAAVVASGYSDDDVMAKHRDYGFDAALEKPFTREQLAQAVRTARERRRG